MVNLQWKHMESFPLVFKIAFVKELLDRVSSHYSCLHVSALSICRECMWLFGRVGVGRCYLECIYSYIPAVTPTERERRSDRGEIY